MNRSAMRLLLMMVLGGLAAALAVGVVISRGGGGSVKWPIIVAIAVVAIGLVLCIIVISMMKRRRRQPDTVPDDLLERLPDGCTLAPIEEPEPQLHRAFGPLPRIPRGGRAQHILRGELDGRAVTCFQHYYVIMTGQTVVPVFHTVVVAAAPRWPAVSIRPRNGLGRLLLCLGFERGLMLEDDRFNRVFRVSAENEDFALTLLSPAMQRFMLEKPTINWRVNPGAVAIVYLGRLRFDRIAWSLERMRRFWSLVEPELSAW
jgi:hypothetical protein